MPNMLEPLSLRIGVVSDRLCPHLDDQECDGGTAFTSSIAALTCRFLHLNCTFDYFGGSYGGVNENGTATGLIGAIAKGEYDASVPAIAPNHQRMRAVAFSHGFFEFDTILITRAPTVGSQRPDWGMFTAFDLPSILALALILVSISIVLSISVRLNSPSPVESPPVDRLSRTSFLGELLDIFVNSFGNLAAFAFAPVALNLSASIRFLLCVWTLASVALQSAYTSKLFSNKVASISNVPYTNLESFVRCLEASRCKLITDSRTSVYFQQLTLPGSDLSDRVVRALERNRLLVYRRQATTPEILHEILEDSSSTFLVHLTAKDFIFHGMTKEHKCRFYVIDAPFRLQAAFTFRKDFPRLEQVNRFALEFRGAGLDRGPRRSPGEMGGQCSSERRMSERVRKTNSLATMRVIFGFYGCGITTGLVLFLLEVSCSFSRHTGMQFGTSRRI